MSQLFCAVLFCVQCFDAGMGMCCEKKTLIGWVKKCMEYEVEGSRPRGRTKRTWREVVQKGYEARRMLWIVIDRRS